MNPSRPADPSLEDEHLISLNEAAKLLHISRSSVYRLVRRGDLPSVRVGFLLRIRASDLQAYMNGTKWVTLSDVQEEPDSNGEAAKGKRKKAPTLTNRRATRDSHKS